LVALDNFIVYLYGCVTQTTMRRKLLAVCGWNRGLLRTSGTSGFGSQLATNCSGPLAALNQQQESWQWLLGDQRRFLRRCVCPQPLVVRVTSFAPYATVSRRECIAVINGASSLTWGRSKPHSRSSCLQSRIKVSQNCCVSFLVRHEHTCLGCGGVQLAHSGRKPARFGWQAYAYTTGLALPSRAVLYTRRTRVSEHHVACQNRKIAILPGPSFFKPSNFDLDSTAARL
jgi:hypothetical protein